MKDIFQRYHRHSVLKNLGVFAIAGFLAVSINLFVLGDTNTQKLKANILELDQQEVTDLIGSIYGESVNFIPTKDIKDVTRLSFDLTYDKNLLNFEKLHSLSTQININVLYPYDGLARVSLNFETAQTLKKDSIIVSLPFTRKVQENSSVAYINIVGAEFEDSQGGKYALTTENIIF